MWKTSLPPVTYDEQSRMDSMRHLGCIACRSVGITNREYLELHHILIGNKRVSHLHTLFLCAGHHQGHWSEKQKRSLDPRYKVAIASGRKPFLLAFGSERELWEQLQASIGQACPWPESKIVPRAYR